MTSDGNTYVTGYQKNPGSQSDGLRTGNIETSLGLRPVPALLAAGSATLSYAQGPRMIQTLRITFAGYAFATTDQTTNGAQGSLALLTLPAKVNLIYPAIVNLAIDGSITYDTAGYYSVVSQIAFGLGSAAAGTNNATLTSTEQDVVASTLVTLSSSLGTFAANGPVPFIQDGTAGAKTMYLNAAMADAFSGGDSHFGLTGTIDFSWLQLNN